MSDPLPTEVTGQQQAALDAVLAGVPQPEIVCADCGRPRTLADDYDYTPLQLITGRPLGWYNGDDEQMCGECLAATMRGERP